jgi:hypothetical protein
VSAYVVYFDTRRYFGAKRFPSFEEARAFLLANFPRSFGAVVRDSAGKRWSFADLKASLPVNLTRNQ